MPEYSELDCRLPPAPGTPLDRSVSNINTAYINTALSDTSGIDATYRYRIETDSVGEFALDMGYSLLFTNKYKQDEDDDLIDYPAMTQPSSIMLLLRASQSMEIWWIGPQPCSALVTAATAAIPRLMV